MPQVIIYPNNEGKVVIVTPNLNCGLTIQQIAQKDVPPNIPYFIVDTSLFPSDLIFSDAWEVDFSNPDGMGANYGVGSMFAVVGWKFDGSPILREEGVLQ